MELTDSELLELGGVLLQLEIASAHSIARDRFGKSFRSDDRQRLRKMGIYHCHYCNRWNKAGDVCEFCDDSDENAIETEAEALEAMEG